MSGRRYWQILNALITIACLIIVAIQFHACWHRYIKYPKLTEVSIQHAAMYPKPELTFCLSDSAKYKFNQTLHHCKIHMDNYFVQTEFKQPIWQSSNDDDDENYCCLFCHNATELYQALMVDPKWLIINMEVKFFDPSVNDQFPSGSYLKANEFWKFKEDLYLGRCYTFYPQTKDSIRSIEISTMYPVKFFIHPPGNLFSLDEDRLGIDLAHRSHDIEAHLDYEVFEGLYQDNCTSDLDRDTCIDDYLHKNLTQEIGCTTPFARNQSVICTDAKLALKAWSITNELLFRNQMELMKHCPKSCTRVQARFAHYRESNTSNVDEFRSNHLTLNFQQYVKVSKTDYSYTFLSFLADVGAFVALFLGASVNQIGYYLETIWNAMKRIIH